MIDRFEGRYFFLSNFWMVETRLDGMVFPSVEHAYQAAKTTDLNIRISIAKMRLPAGAKRFGRTLPQRKGWEEIKLGIMEDLVRLKFTSCHDLRRRLLATGGIKLVEGNAWGDTYWGVCKRVGENHLGKILMKIRGELTCPQ